MGIPDLKETEDSIGRSPVARQLSQLLKRVTSIPYNLSKSSLNKAVYCYAVIIVILSSYVAVRKYFYDFWALILVRKRRTFKI